MGNVLILLFFISAFTTTAQAQNCPEALAYYVTTKVEGEPASIVSQTVCSGEAEARPLAESPWQAGVGLGAWSVTRRALAYGYGTLYVLNAGNSTPREVISESAKVRYTNPSWSPDGTHISLLEIEKPDDAYWISVTDLSGNVRRIAQLGGGELEESVVTPVLWSPDGAWISYTRSRKLDDEYWDTYIELLSTACVDDPNQPCEPHVLAVTDNSGERPFFDLDDGRSVPEEWWGAAWSPDGGQLAFVCGENLCFLNADGSDLRRSDDEFMGHSLTWSPSGRYLGYTSRDEDIYVYDLETGKSRNLTQTPDVQEFLPMWIPLPEGAYLFEASTGGEDQ